MKDEAEKELFIKHAGEPETFFGESTKSYDAKTMSNLIKISERYLHLLGWKSYKTKYVNTLKEELLTLLSQSVEYNSMADNKCIRQLRDEAVIDKNIISVFESSLTRMLGHDKDELTTDIMVVKVYYFDIIQDLILNGFEYQGEKYMFFTASAGQIRTKKTVFIKESLWKQHERTLMCGLTVDEINAQGGINVNKYLAYLALSNSATDEWVDFDIDRCIVVPDFETDVHGTVDFIDDKTYEVERCEMDIGIEHTDGCGMMLPSVSQKNFMVRLPWIKGLLSSFDFRKFIEVHDCSPIVTDIYGQEHDIIAEDIQIIFTKSQFKMAKYYADWNQYKDFFRTYNCQAGFCKVEEDYIKPAHINYQMLQTLTDITDEEILKIADTGINILRNLTSNVGIMLDAFGATPGRSNLSSFQQALQIYPEMLNDEYCKQTLKEIKKSRVINYRAGKLPVKGKFTFVVPDMYAFCEYMFLHIDNPNGLLNDGQVSCRLYKRAEKLDCLRSPHLYREHAVRNNTFSPEIEEWFQTDAVYTSCKDLISKILQFDCDGDTLLVVADKTIVEVAERNMEGIVPLFYDMKKAEPAILTNEELYKGMTAAWTGGNIGAISNDITKIWNCGDTISEKELLAVKLLCCDNNYVIDYAKTLYKPTRPSHIDKFIREYTNAKMPHFFKYAKGYAPSQVEQLNNSFVNKLHKYIKDKRLSFKNFSEFDYHNLMSDPYIVIDERVLNVYGELNKSYHFKIGRDDNSHNNIPYIKLNVKEELARFGYSDTELSDMLVAFLYGNGSEYKNLLWLCYGDIILENIKRNVDTSLPACMKCGKRFVQRGPHHKYCDHCFLEKIKGEDQRIKTCKDCGEEFLVHRSVRNKPRCDKCQEKAKLELTKNRVQKFRERHAM